MDYKNASDADLMSMLKNKDKEAFKELMTRYQYSIYKTAYRFTGNDDSARDLTQDIFFKVYRSSASYTPDAKFFTWLYRVAVNHCINYSKKQGRETLKPGDEIYEVSQGLSQYDIVEKEERDQIVRNALDMLPERQRLALLLLRFENLSYKETAQILRCSVSAVEALVARGMSAMKDQLSILFRKGL